MFEKETIQKVSSDSKFPALTVPFCINICKQNNQNGGIYEGNNPNRSYGKYVLQNSLC